MPSEIKSLNNVTDSELGKDSSISSGSSWWQLQECASQDKGRHIIAISLLIGLAIVGTYARLSVLFGVEFLFGSIPAFIALILYGQRAAWIVSLASALVTWKIWNHPYFIPINMGEMIFVICARKYFKANLLIAVTAYWLLLAPPLVYVFYGLILKTGNFGVVLILLKQVVNGIFNAFIASSCLIALQLFRRRSDDLESLVPIHQVFFHVLLAIAFVPSLVLLHVNNQTRLDRMEATVISDVRNTAEGISHFLVDWQQSRLNTVSELAESARRFNFKPSPELQDHSLLIMRASSSFYSMYVANAEAKTVAFVPSTTNEGTQLIGMSFADRPYYKKMLETKAPVISDVFMGRGGVNFPIVTFSAPVIEGNKLIGYALGASPVDWIRVILQRFTEHAGIEATVVDREGYIVASTVANLHPLMKYTDPVELETAGIAPQTFRRMSKKPNVPIFVAWQNALYGYWMDVPGLGWRIYSETPLAQHSILMEEFVVENLSHLLAICLFGLLFSALLSRGIGRPLQELASTTTNLADQLRNGFSMDWPKTRLRELALMINNFKAMTIELLVRFRELEHAYATISQASQELAIKNSALTHEIDVRLKAEARLNEAIGAAQAANKAKGEFLANMSHEIRTPLGAIIGFAELMMTESMSNELLRERLQMISRNGEQLLAVIGDVLDLSKIEAGELKTEILSVDLYELIAGGVKTLEEQARSKGLNFSVRYEGELPKLIHTDPTRIRQILLNLVGNAIKFTDHGEIIVSIRLLAPAAHHIDRQKLQIEVADTGIGISREEQARLFQLFTQADSSTTRRFGGTGLGLVLSRRLAEALSGELLLNESEPGKGSRFTLTFDAGPIELSQNKFSSASPLLLTAHNHASKDKISLEKVRALVIDDAPDNRLLIGCILQDAGAEVELASTGRDGLEKAFLKSFDLVITDIQMPEMDGYEVIQELRNRGFAAPIIALTAHALIDEKNRCMKIGCDDYLTKPIRGRTLLERIAFLISEHKKQ